MKNSLPACITKASTLADNTIRLTVDCQEMGAEDMSELFSLKGKLGWFFFHEKPIDKIDATKLPPISLERHEKSPSERLHAVLYVYWLQNKIDEKFDMFYKRKMEEMIDLIKSKLEPV